MPGAMWVCARLSELFSVLFVYPGVLKTNKFEFWPVFAGFIAWLATRVDRACRSGADTVPRVCFNEEKEVWLVGDLSWQFFRRWWYCV